MTLLAGRSYDPTTAVSASCAAALAMTALDTTNLRVSFTAPSTGNVLVHMRCNVHGATTFPQVLLGVLQSGTVICRAPTSQTQGGTALATTMLLLEAMIVVSSLTPGGSYTWDAAYGVETAVTSSAIKYGGPNNATANDAFGAFTFGVWSA